MMMLPLDIRDKFYVIWDGHTELLPDREQCGNTALRCMDEALAVDPSTGEGRRAYAARSRDNQAKIRRRKGIREIKTAVHRVER